MSSRQRLTHQHYAIGWICALPLERAVAEAMLDDVHANLPQRRHDHNVYTLGEIGVHNIVISCLPSGVYGTVSAAVVADQMITTFPNIRFSLMVGIGGGIPGPDADVRLGDIVVSRPANTFGGVIQWDFGKTTGDGRFQRTGALNKPPAVLLSAISKLESEHTMRGNNILGILDEMVNQYPHMAAYQRPPQTEDELFDATYEHVEGGNRRTPCENCSGRKLVRRAFRETDQPQVHYGLIASGNQVIRHAATRDQLAQELGVLCVEMEAAGLMDHMLCLLIRGICDYADSHKNKLWQQYAAATAAAYAKELLAVIPEDQVTSTHTMADIMGDEVSYPAPTRSIEPSSQRIRDNSMIPTGSHALPSTQQASTTRYARTHIPPELYTPRAYTPGLYVRGLYTPGYVERPLQSPDASSHSVEARAAYHLQLLNPDLELLSRRARRSATPLRSYLDLLRQNPHFDMLGNLVTEHRHLQEPIFQQIAAGIPQLEQLIAQNPGDLRQICTDHLDGDVDQPMMALEPWIINLIIYVAYNMD